MLKHYPQQSADNANECANNDRQTCRVASYLKLNERAVYRMVMSVKIPAFKVGTP